MCRAFSCLVTKSKKVYWQAGMDNHSDIHDKFVKKGKELKDDKLPPHNTFARIEVVPKNGNYLKPDKWELFIDERVRPKFLTKSHESACLKEFKKWEKKVYKFNQKEALNPIHPFKIKPPKNITKRHLKLLLQWNSVGDSVWNSIRDSIGDSIGDSVGDSVWYSVWAYTGSLFPNIKKWKYCNKRKKVFRDIKGYPFQSAVKLWKMGLVASYNRNDSKWRIHGGKKPKILWEGTVKELKEQCK